MTEEKTYVEDIDRSLYDFRYEDKDAWKVDEGLSADIIETISREKNDPEWMREFRLRSLEIYNRTPMVDWGPDIEGLDMKNIVTYVRPNTKMTADWEDVPETIRDTFEKLGIPQAERESLAGVGAQYDSELVYHNVKKEVAEQGVVYTDLESAMHGPYAEMIRSHFMKLFREYTHTTCISYINKCRLTKAVELLETTRFNILDVATAVGYNNISLFNRDFKKIYGTTPKEVRKNARIEEKLNRSRKLTL